MERGLKNVILVYSRTIWKYKYKQLNYTKCVGDNSNAVHILGQEGTSSTFLEKVEIGVKKCKSPQKYKQIGNFFATFERSTFMHVTIACLKS